MTLSVRGVTKAFGATRALSGVSLEAASGEVHAVLGENGAGKSTLMKVLAGAEAPDEGTVSLDGVPFRPRNPRDARTAGVALVSQELAICPHLTVAENVLLGDEPTRFGFLDGAKGRREVARVLDEVAAGRIREDARAGDLPLPDQQLIEIARALVRKCKVLILDEPTSSLGREDTERLFSLIARLRGEGVTILYISHFLEEVARVADRYTVLRDGESVKSGAMGDMPLRGLVALMAGKTADDSSERDESARAARAPGDVALSLASLAGTPKPISASLELRRGEVLGIAGLVGAGRTELLRAIFGLDPITSGTVRVGAYSGGATPRVRLAQGVGMLSEDRRGEGLATTLSIADNVTLSKHAGLGFFGGSAIDRALGLVSPAKQEQAAARFIGELSIKCRDASQRVSELSGGNQQKVALARLLHHDVDVLLLDEPTRGVDVSAKAQIHALVRRLAEAGKAVLLVSSYLPELLEVCDRIAVMCRGRLGAARDAHEWTERTLLEEAVGVS